MCYLHRKNSWLGGHMLSFVKRDYGGSKIYYPDLVLKMNTKALNGQGLTWPDGFWAGANRWLDERRSSLNLAGSWYMGATAPNSVRWTMYSLAMNSIGTKDEPGVALYATDSGFLEHHYTPTLEGRLYNWRVTAEVLVRIPWGETNGPNDGNFKNITSFLQAGGYYALR